MLQAARYFLIAFLVSATIAVAGRWDGDYTQLGTGSLYYADAGSGITVTIPQSSYIKVTCDKDFRGAGGAAQADGGFFCHDLTGRCDLFRSSLGEKMYMQANGSSNKVAIQAANATELATCRIYTSRN